MRRFLPVLLCYPLAALASDPALDDITRCMRANIPETVRIQQVEISTDGGERWELAALDVPLAPAAWRFWRYEWVVRQSGRYTLLVRATDGTGRLQTSIEQEPAPDGAAGLHEITVTVLA